jgi:hypothetical protein
MSLLHTAHAILSLDVTSPPPSRETGTETNAGVTCRIAGLWTFIRCNTRDTLEWCSLLSPVEVVRERLPHAHWPTPQPQVASHLTSDGLIIAHRILAASPKTTVSLPPRALLSLTCNRPAPLLSRPVCQ